MENKKFPWPITKSITLFLFSQQYPIQQPEHVEVAHTCADESMSVLTITYLVEVKRTTKMVVLGKRSLIGKDELQGFIYRVNRSYKRSLNV